MEASGRPHLHVWTNCSLLSPNTAPTFFQITKTEEIIHVFHSRTEYRVKSSWRILLEKSFSLYLTGTLGSRTFMYLGLQVASSLKSLSCPLRSIRTTKSLLSLPPTSCFYPTMLLLLIKVFMLGFVREAWSRKQALERCQDKHVIYWQKEKKGKALKQELEPGIWTQEDQQLWGTRAGNPEE